jgi:hypothetical protein
VPAAGQALVVASLAETDIRAIARRLWWPIATGLGVIAVFGIAVAAASASSTQDDYRANAASLILLGGLVIALGLGASAFFRAVGGGRLALVASAGPPRSQVAYGLLLSRVLALAVTLAVWLAALQVGSLAIGEGLDGPLAVHVGAMFVSLSIALLAAGAAATSVGPYAAAIFGLIVYVLAQAAVNLNAAASDDALGTANGLGRILYWIFPRTITSPMIADLQARDVAGPAAPVIDINQNVITVPASGLGPLIWTLAWCVLLAVLAGLGLRRRPL